MNHMRSSRPSGNRQKNRQSQISPWSRPWFNVPLMNVTRHVILAAIGFACIACGADRVVPPPPGPVSEIDVTIENLAPGRDRDGFIVMLASNASFTVGNEA